MGKKDIKNIFWKIISHIFFIYICLGGIVIIELHSVVSFFPVLFLFDFCFVVGYPMFLRYVLKRKWFECTKDDYLKVKYILLPWSIMETMLMLSYYNHILFVLQKIAEN